MKDHVDNAFSLNLQVARELRAALKEERSPAKRNALLTALRLNSRLRDVMLDRL